MRYTGSLRYLLASRWPVNLAADETLPEIAPGAFAAWAQAAKDREALRLAAGDSCLTPDGRTGRVVEILESGHQVLVCQPT